MFREAVEKRIKDPQGKLTWLKIKQKGLSSLSFMIDQDVALQML